MSRMWQSILKCFKRPICPLGCMPPVFRAFTGSYCTPQLIAMPTKGELKIMQRDHQEDEIDRMTFTVSKVLQPLQLLHYGIIPKGQIGCGDVKEVSCVSRFVVHFLHGLAFSSATNHAH